MTIEKLRQIHQSQPFQPFTMYFADGGRLHVSHPESLAYSPSGRTIVVVSPDDSSQFIDLLMVTRIELGNGKARRPRGRRT